MNQKGFQREGEVTIKIAENPMKMSLCSTKWVGQNLYQMNMKVWLYGTWPFIKIILSHTFISQKDSYIDSLAVWRV